MVTFKHVPVSGDPSDKVQYFAPVNLKIMCCRYWWLEKWTSHEMSFPYWRLYWNKNEGAYVKTHKKVYLSNKKLVLIPPETSFSTGIDYIPGKSSTNPNDLVGNRISDKKEEQMMIKESKIAHLFIHFNLAFNLERSGNKVYSFDINDEQKEIIDRLICKLLDDSSEFNVVDTLRLHKLIFSVISMVPAKYLNLRKVDDRISFLTDYIEEHLGDRLANKELAQKIYMSTNSFTRFFKEQMMVSPQEFVRKTRIDKASNLLEDSSLSIDDIAERCGFTDRFHFSKVFKKLKGIPPVEYRKKYVLGYGG